jgi:hypothetical protein
MTATMQRSRLFAVQSGLAMVVVCLSACGLSAGVSSSTASGSASDAGSSGAFASDSAAATTSDGAHRTGSSVPESSSADAGRATTAEGGAAAGAAAAQLHVVRAPKVVFDDMHLSPGQCRIRTAAGGQPLPDPACTPGAIDPAVTQSNIKSTICTPGYTATVRPPAAETGKWKKESEADYGAGGSKDEYDHLVSLELGGTNATSNLWPEPGSVPNPKDAVENRLHKEVCDGQMTLAAAQAAIASDWTTVP